MKSIVSRSIRGGSNLRTTIRPPALLLQLPPLPNPPWGRTAGDTATRSSSVTSPADAPPPPETPGPVKEKYQLPKRIILIRHGESLGNVDETAYQNIPDWKIPLTRRGERQALRAANELATLLQGEALFAYCSPYKRAKETWHIIESYLRGENVEVIGMREEPRVAEQQFGNFQNPHKVRTAKAERRTYGRFFFRFPNGEAGLDVYNRASSFLATLSRDIRQIDERYSLLHHDRPAGDAMAAMNILVVTHGLTLRLILMRYFQLSVEEFENSYNSQNARLVVMDRMVDSAGREYYRLHETAKEALNFMGDVSNEKPVYWRHDVAGGVGDGLFTMKDDDVEE